VENTPEKTNPGALSSIAEAILGSDTYQGLYTFFKNIIQREEKDGETYYIAFITRRCSCLAHLFLRILKGENYSSENVSGRCNVKLLTNTALVNFAWKIGQKIVSIAMKREHKEYSGTSEKGGADDTIEHLPYVILVDDAISYGRTLSGVLDGFEKVLDQAISAYRSAWEGITNEQIELIDRLRENFLKNRIRVRIYAEKEQTKLLSSSTAQILTCEKKMNHYRWNDYSVRLTELVSNADVANTAFVLSAGANAVPKDFAEWASVWDAHKSEYAGHEQTVFLFKPVKRAICTVRYIQCGVNTNYRVVPFVILPELTESSFLELENKVISDIQDKLRVYDGKTDSTGELELKKHLCHQTMRSRLEFVTMYLSTSLLKIFVQQIGEIDSKSFDLEKIITNYADCREKMGLLRLLVTAFAPENSADLLYGEDELIGILNELPAHFSDQAS
jgi:hypothetical protein